MLKSKMLKMFTVLPSRQHFDEVNLGPKLAIFSYIYILYQLFYAKKCENIHFLNNSYMTSPHVSVRKQSIYSIYNKI